MQAVYSNKPYIISFLLILEKQSFTSHSDTPPLFKIKNEVTEEAVDFAHARRIDGYPPETFTDSL